MKSPSVMKHAHSLSGTTLGDRLAALLQNGSVSQKRLANFILRSPIRAASASIEDMARASGVSAPTISRFVRELGLHGFAEMRTALADTLQIIMDPVAKLRSRLEADPSSRQGAAMFEAIRSQMNMIDADGVDRQVAGIIGHLAAARSVHVMGFGLSAHVAAILVLGLQPFHPNVSGVVEFGGTEVAAGRLMGIGPGDVLIAITFPRYASDVVKLTGYARDKGATVIALTDSAASPLAPLAHELLLAPSDHPVLSSSMVAPVAVAETIVTAMMLSDKDNAEKAARLTQAIAAYLYRDGV